jgi:hypothetical protein
MEIDVPPMTSRLLRISTEMLPERERFSALQEEFAQKILKMDLIDRGGRCPRIEVAFVPLGAAAAGAINCTSAEFIRRNHHLKDCSDDFRLTIVATGTVQVFAIAAGPILLIKHGPTEDFGHVPSASEMSRCRQLH